MPVPPITGCASFCEATICCRKCWSSSTLDERAQVPGGPASASSISTLFKLCNQISLHPESVYYIRALTYLRTIFNQGTLDSAIYKCQGRTPPIPHQYWLLLDCCWGGLRQPSRYVIPKPSNSDKSDRVIAQVGYPLTWQDGIAGIQPFDRSIFWDCSHSSLEPDDRNI